jgi:membrane-bound serine protease (ClpP class)
VPAIGFAVEGRDPFPSRIAATVKRLLLLGVLTAAIAAPGATAASTAPPKVLAIHFALDINPVTQDWLDSQLTRAENGGYSAAVIVLDTPGGLEDSMRKIVQKELGLRIPVIVYISPPGARGASAGVWLSQAADVLAMAPGTNIGSSTPIESSGQNIGSDLRRKEINDSAASLRGLAQLHGRNAAWADAAVRVASNLTDAEALKMNVIDLIAPSLPALLAQVNGRHTKAGSRVFTLHTADATITTSSPGFGTRFLSTLIDPNIVGVLFLAGIAGLAFEIFHPGIVLPGALGAVCMLTALFGFSVLPISWEGLALVLLGVGLLGADLHVPSHGALTVSGLLALGIGLATLFHNAPAPYHTSIWLVLTFTAAIGGFWAFALSKAMAAREQPVSVGPEEIVGMEGVVRDGGLVFVRGELWRAQAAETLAPGERVRVDALNGLTLDVHRV